jgi:hypothetical protein
MNVNCNVLIFIDDRAAWRPMPAALNTSYFNGAHLVPTMDVLIPDGDAASKAPKHTVYQLSIMGAKYYVDAADPTNALLLKQLKVLK